MFQHFIIHDYFILPIGLVGYVLLKNKDWQKKLKGLQNIDWRKSSPIWQDKVVMDNKMLKHKLGIKRAADEILKQLNVSDRIDGNA